MNSIMIFSDLDGSLLNHFDYRFEAALPLITALKHRGIPVIPNTSKTAKEIELICTEIGLDDGFICENGAAVYLPKAKYTVSQDHTFTDCGHYWRQSFVQPRSHWQTLLETVPTDLSSCFKSFATLGVEGIMAATGLPKANAELSSQREFNEPLLWLGNDAQKADFIQFMQHNGATLLQGGRFLHVGGHCDKSTAMQWFANFYAQHHQLTTTVNTIAIGDSGNDIAMLEAADAAVVVKAPNKDYPTISTASPTFFTTQIAPEGWHEGVSAAVKALENN